MTLPVSLSPGEQVYKYTLQKQLGDGSFGEVWLARDQGVNSDFAVKFLDASKVAPGKLLKEAEVGYRTNHGNLVTVHYADVIDYDGTPLVAVVMDYFPNGSVLNQVCAGNFVPIQIATAQTIGILRGLEFLHEQGTLHNDIKPQNILVGPNGEGVLTDYGIAERTNGAATAKPAAAYRLHKAPEVIQKKQIGVRTDIYQVGMTLFRLVNGLGTVRDKLALLGPTEFEQLVQRGKLITAADYQLFVPNTLRRIIAKAISKDPADRYQSALEMRRALERLSLRGVWKIDGTGDFAGEDQACTYRVVLESMRGGKFRFTAFRTRKKSGAESRVGKYCATGLTNQAALKSQQKFMCAVVEGKL
jgi:eukaryotic-like serine/threonine-protein kinase